MLASMVKVRRLSCHNHRAASIIWTKLYAIPIGTEESNGANGILLKTTDQIPGTTLTFWPRSSTSVLVASGVLRSPGDLHSGFAGDVTVHLPWFLNSFSSSPIPSIFLHPHIDISCVENIKALFLFLVQASLARRNLGGCPDIVYL